MSAFCVGSTAVKPNICYAFFTECVRHFLTSSPYQPVLAYFFRLGAGASTVKLYRDQILTVPGSFAAIFS